MASLIDTYGMPSDADLKSHDGACRYVSHTAGKTVTKSQVQHIHSLGKTVVLNFEDSATNAKGGLKQGQADGEFFVEQAKKIGAPAHVAGYFSVDFEIHTEFGTVEQYFKGVAEKLNAAGYLVGGYGDYDLIRDLVAKKMIVFGWQTAAWSYEKRDTDAVLIQDVFTQGYDVDEIKHSYYGGWTPNGAQTPPEVDMTPDETERMIMNALLAYSTGKDHGVFTHKEHPTLVPGDNKGVYDRLNKLEKK
jgi:hypothetical protein